MIYIMTNKKKEKEEIKEKEEVKDEQMKIEGKE